MSFIKNDSAQAGGLAMVFIGLVIAGIFYVAFGAIMNQFEVTDNAIISGGTIAYSQDHYNATGLIYKYWWAVPVYVVLLYVIYGIKNALTKEFGQV